MRKLVVLVLASLVVAAVAAPSASGARAFVFKDGDVGCATEPGDVPGTGVFALPKATAVFLANGGVVLECHGMLPAGVSFPSTLLLRVSCDGVPNAERTRERVLPQSGVLTGEGRHHGTLFLLVITAVIVRGRKGLPPVALAHADPPGPVGVRAPALRPRRASRGVI